MVAVETFTNTCAFLAFKDSRSLWLSALTENRTWNISVAHHHPLTDSCWQSRKSLRAHTSSWKLRGTSGKSRGVSSAPAVTHTIAASGEHLDLLQMLDSKPSRPKKPIILSALLPLWVGVVFNKHLKDCFPVIAKLERDSVERRKNSRLRRGNTVLLSVRNFIKEV